MQLVELGVIEKLADRVGLAEPGREALTVSVCAAQDFRRRQVACRDQQQRAMPRDASRPNRQRYREDQAEQDR